MSDNDRNDSNVWFFLMGFVLGVLIAGGGVATYYVIQHQQLGRDIRAMRDRAERAALEAKDAEMEARSQMLRAKQEREKALEALTKIKKLK